MGLLSKAREIVASRDVGLWARLTASGRGPTAGQLASTGQSPANPAGTAVPAQVQQAMAEQGMVWGDPFSPGSPIPPFQPEGTPPVKRVFRVGENVYLQPRAAAGVDFGTMQQVLEKWDLANLCINTRIDQLRLPDWTISARRREDKDRYADELHRLRAMFERPDGEVAFDTWIAKLARDWLMYDAACIFRHRNRAGKVIGLEVIDGTTVALLSDGRGGVPKSPAPAYVQWAWGMPWVWMTTRDLIYEPYWPRAKSRYGYPPIEWLLIQGNTDLRLQLFFLEFFTEGEVPATWLEAPEGLNPQQLDELQRKYNALLSGQRGVHHKVAFIPNGTKPYPMKEAALSAWVPFANYVVVKTCSSFGIQPAEIGWTENVNKATGEGQENIQYRRSILPSARYISERLNRLLSEDLGAPWAKFEFLGVEEEDDKFKLAQVDEILIRNAVKSPDQAAIERGLPVDENNPVGRLFVLRTGVAFIQDARASSAALATQTAAQAGLGIDDANDLADAEDEDAAPAIEVPAGVRTEGALRPKPATGSVAPAAAGAPGVERSLRSELRKWRSLAVDRAKAGKAQRPFVSDVIPEPLGKAIAAELSLAGSTAEVRAVFASYLGGDAPPKVRKTQTQEDKDRRRREAELTALLLLLLRREGADVADYVRQHWPSELTGTALTAAAERLVDAYPWQDAWSRVAAEIAPHATEAARGAASGAAGPEAADAATAAAEAWAKGRAAEMVGRARLPDGTLIDNPNAPWRIDESTRQMIRDEVARGIRDGLTPEQIAEAIRTGAAFSPQRAALIARTELALANNHGAIEGVRAAGGDRVAVTDGEEYDAACVEADGQTWSLAYASAHALEHPRCVRRFWPTDPNAQIDRP